MQFEATIRFDQNCIWKGIQFDEALTFQVAVPAQTAKAGPGWDNFLYQSQNPGVQIPGGTLWSVKGQATFVLTEQGWAAQSIVHGEIARTTDVVQSAEPRPALGSPGAQELGPTNAELAKLLLTSPTRSAGDVMCTGLETARAICPAGFAIQVTATGVKDEARFSSLTNPDDMFFLIQSRVQGLFGPRSTASAIEREAQWYRDNVSIIAMVGPVPSKIGKYDASTVFVTYRNVNGVICQSLTTTTLVGRRILSVSFSGTVPNVAKSWGMYSEICDSFVYPVK
jgi:hypothetical protein